MADRQIKIDIIGDSKKYTAALDDATGKTGKFNDLMKGAAMGVGMAGFNMLTDAASTMVAKLGDCQTAYRNDQKSQTMLAESFNRAGVARNESISQMEDQIATNQALGVSDSDQRDGIRDFIDLTKDAATAMKLNQAAIELSAAKGIDYASAVAEIKSGVEGKTKALEKDGVTIKKGADATQVATAILDKFTGSQKALAQTSEGKVKISQEKVGEAMEKIGSVVDRLSQIALPILADAFSGIVDTSMAVYDALQPTIDQVVALVQTFTGGGTKISGVSTDVQNVIQKLSETFKREFDLIQAAVTFFVGVFTQIWDKYGKDIMNQIEAVWRFITEIFNAALKVINGILDIFTGIFSGDWNKVWTGIQEVFSGVWDAIQAIIRYALSTITNLVSAAFTALGGVVDGIWQGILTLISGVWNGIIDLVQWDIDTTVSIITNAFNGVIDFITGLPGRIADGARGMFDGIATAAKMGINGAIAALNGIIDGINSIQLHINIHPPFGPGIDFDWGGMGLGHIGYMHQGGVVPGNGDFATILQGGELVIPKPYAQQAMGNTTHITINVPGGFIGSEEQLTRLIAKGLRLQGVTI